MRIDQEKYFSAIDGARLFYRYWPATEGMVGQDCILRRVSNPPSDAPNGVPPTPSTSHRPGEAILRTAPTFCGVDAHVCESLPVSGRIADPSPMHEFGGDLDSAPLLSGTDDRFFSSVSGINDRVVSSAISPRALILLHRGHEHSGRMRHIVDEIDLPGFAFFAWDARGHGHSPAGDGTITLGTFVKDLDTFARHIQTEYGIAPENIGVIGQSVGSVLAAAWVHDYAPRIRCMVLGAPAFKVRLYVPFAKAGLAVWQAVHGDFHVNSYVKAKYLTHDPERIASYDSDPLIKRPISARILLGLYTTADRIVSDAGAIHTPTQVLMSGKDWVVDTKAQDDFFARLGSPTKEKHVFPGFYHDTLGEKDRRLAIEKARAFIVDAFSRPAARPDLLDSDKAGYTKEEFDRLRCPLPSLSLKALNFGISKLSMRTGGKLSDGIRLGCQTGFDSGSTLDYVYRNRPHGVTPIGTTIDWFYLNAIGWRGIRVRKLHMERLLHSAMERVAATGRPVRIIDIAAGHGRYVLDTIQSNGIKADNVLLRDYSDLNVQKGSALIARRALQDIARFEKGDAFSRESLAAISPRPTVAVVSGLYELFPDNAPVRESLAGIAEAIEPGGYLVYTGQPWHPQLEMIARVLASHRDGKPWIMRRRTQAEMDQLVESAGFTKLDELIDEWGIFTVSLAQRLSA